ncbi:hypothetical protein IPA_08215 [Ignicoccus pacificus DSM 13166]|uniref:Uncharacterized protein n=1 Tax=Ignicoccus pacificus DSM 13166 TaxID=940294 RepID=A0A977PLS4_9CREN|nr:hypothetical protein IPA_08215 [Ignicoccus pacificus DSM 13166]
MDINERSRIFVNVSSKLVLLTNAKRVGKGRYTLEELKEKSKGLKNSCLLVKMKDIRGYILLCDGEVYAIAFQEPPALGERALALIGEDPIRVEIYEVPKDAVKRAEEFLGLKEEVKQMGEKVGRVLAGLSEKKKAKKEEKEEEILEESLTEGVITEIPSEEEIQVEVPPLEVLELIDLITLSDELAYYLEREGIEAESDTPVSLDSTYVIKINIREPVGIEELVRALYEAAKKSEATTLIEVNLPGGAKYYFDPILYQGFNEVMRRFGITEDVITYIEAQGKDKATIVASLRSMLPSRYASRIIASLVDVARKRRLPWKNISLNVRAGSMVLVGEVL